jgi:peptidylprolyl isomerase
MVFLRLVLYLAVVCGLVACGGSGKQGVAIEAPDPVVESDFVKTESGLQYYDFKVGEGASPSKGKKVTVHYSGWLTDGKLFDSSVVKNRPFTFEIGRRRVIKGWDEGVMSMKVGGIRQLKIPPGLAYGEGGVGPIPPNATLIFEVELLEVK